MWGYFRKSIVLNLLFFVAVIFVGYSAYNMVKGALVLRQEWHDIKQKVGDLGQKKLQLEASLAELETKEAMEREAKSRFNLKNPGEEVVVVVSDKKDNGEAGGPANVWSRIKSFFKGLF